MMKMIKNIIVGLIFGYIPNYIVNKIPSYKIRHYYLKNILRIKMENGVTVHLDCFIEKGRSHKAIIRENSVINRKCFLDFRGGIEIGKNVSISSYVKLITGSHDKNDEKFKYISKSIIIEDYVWIGTGAIILPGVTLKEGSVVAAGSVVTKNVESYSFVAGNPAVEKGKRNRKLSYSTKYERLFD